MHNSKGVTEPCVVGSGIAELGSSQLADVVEALKDGCVDELSFKVCYEDVSMNRVADVAPHLEGVASFFHLAASISSSTIFFRASCTCMIGFSASTIS